MVGCFGLGASDGRAVRGAEDVASEVSSLKSDDGDRTPRNEADVMVYNFGRRPGAQVTVVDTKKSIVAAMPSFSRANRKDLLLLVLAKLFSDQACAAELNELARLDPTALRFIMPLVINTMLYGFNHMNVTESEPAGAQTVSHSARATDLLAGPSAAEKALEEWLYAQSIRSVHFAVLASWYLSSSLVLGHPAQHHRTMTLLLGMEAAVTMYRPPTDALVRKATLDSETEGDTREPNARATTAASAAEPELKLDSVEQQQSEDVKQFMQLRKQRGNVFHAELDFVRCLTQISWQLFLVPRPDRKRALQAELERLNKHIPTTAYLPSIRAAHRVLRVCPEEAFPFSTKERCPFMLVAEVLLLDDPRESRAGSAAQALDSDGHDAANLERERSDGVPHRRSSLRGASSSAKKSVSDSRQEAEMRMEPNHAEAAFDFKPSLIAVANDVDKAEEDVTEPVSAAADPEVLKAFGEPWKQKVGRIREASPYGKDPHWRLVSVIVKARDQLRQEMFAARLVRFHERVFKAARLPLWVRAYDIEATSSDSGFIEAVVNSNSLDSIKKNTPGFTTLKDYFRRKYGDFDTVAYKQAVRNFVLSMAGYSVISYILQVKDRHNGNLLLDSKGHLIHIDFGFLLSNSPGGNREFEKAAFKLTTEMVELMGGIHSGYFHLFRKLCCRGYVEVCRQRNKLLLMVDLMMQGNTEMPCFVRGRHYVLSSLSARLTPGKSSGERKRFFNKLIDSAAGNLTTKGYDMYQKCFTGIH
mmetsp:Transcript_10013/g.26715  ORF Transcript_10013/g.26715 Transcript_10013/m.26715 type:complete len:757 (+) Transcript_10013:158-2428(+)